MVFMYFLLCLLCFSLITWVMLQSITKTNSRPDNNDDDGGLPGDGNFPIIDLPPGGKIEDLMVDRWHGDALRQPTLKV
jgi:hypothetical protein